MIKIKKINKGKLMINKILEFSKNQDLIQSLKKDNVLSSIQLYYYQVLNVTRKTNLNVKGYKTRT